MKKLIPIVLIMLILCGCSSLLETSQEFTTPHNPSKVEDSSDPLYIEVSDYEDLQQAMHTLVSAHEENGIIRFSSYNGNIEQDLNSACIYISNDTAIGSYSGAYVASSLNRFVSYYEANLTITYKKDAADIGSIISISSVAELEPLLTEALKNYSETIAIRTTNDSINSDSINSVIRNLYYSDPQLIVSMPGVNIIQHSDTTQISHIYEVELAYINSESIMNERMKFLQAFKTQLDPEFSNIENEAQLLYQLCVYLSDRTDYIGTVPDDEFVQSEMVNTAYGALQQVKASSEGFAMAMKLLCDWYEIDCKVIVGRYDNYIHAWNMIKVNGDWYHFDITKLSQTPSGALLLTDSQMDNNYSWDKTAYPVCNGDLDHTYLTGSGQIEPSVPVTGPVSPPDESDSEQGDIPAVPNE